MSGLHQQLLSNPSEELTTIFIALTDLIRIEVVVCDAWWFKPLLPRLPSEELTASASHLVFV